MVPGGLFLCQASATAICSQAAIRPLDSLLCFPDFAILLYSGRAQAADTMPIDQALPRKEFLDREIVTAAGVVEADYTRTDGHDYLGLPADDPAFRVWCWQIV